jgi:hypothetical protein
MKLPATIDPRYHDAVLFDLDGALAGDVQLLGPTVDWPGSCGESAWLERLAAGGVKLNRLHSTALRSPTGRRC